MFCLNLKRREGDRQTWRNAFDSRERCFQNPSQTAKMELFVKIANRLKTWTIFAKHFILDVWLSSENVSARSVTFLTVKKQYGWKITDGLSIRFKRPNSCINPDNRVITVNVPGLTLFLPMFPFDPPENIRKPNQRFSDIFREIKRDNCEEKS